MSFLRLTSCLFFSVVFSAVYSNIFAQAPNILLVIADDLGVDYSNGYHRGNLMPNTPTLDNLRATGITFENVFSTPKCTPSRATIMSGKYGIKTGVLGTPGHLDTSHTSIFKAIEKQTNGQYADAVIGKWHIAHPADPLHPLAHGVDYYTGLLSSMVDDYYAWERTENGQTTIDSNYATTALTNTAIDWVNAQNQPWFLWLAHIAPHSPFHTPPDSLYSINNTNTNKRKYVAMIESIDHELGRLLKSMSDDARNNTLVIFLGDNGTPNGVLQDYPDGHGKSSVYQGGIRVPLLISGAGVTRKGEREAALIHITDIYATLLEVVGADLAGGIYNSLSFKHLLDNSPMKKTRDFNYVDFAEGGVDQFAIRDARYKLIQAGNGNQEFYDLLVDSLETNDLLIAGLTANQLTIKSNLEQEATQIRTAWSCRDHIQNGDETGIDCGGTYCQPCTTPATSLEEKLISIFPNPAENDLQVVLPTNDYELRIIDVNGQTLHQASITGGQHTLSLAHLPSGLYCFYFRDKGSNQITIKKVVKQ